MTMRRYLLHVLLAACCSGLLLSGFIWLIDPYWIYHEHTADRLNRLKPQVEFNLRIFKTLHVSTQPVDNLILGTSRANQGIDPAHPAFRDGVTFNAAIDGQTYRESYLLYKTAVALHPPKMVVLGLDFFPSNALLADPPDFTDSNYSSYRALGLLLTTHALADAAQTLLVNRGIDLPKDLDNRYLANGLHALGPAYLHELGGHHRHSFQSEKFFFLKIYRPAPRCEHLFRDPESGRAPIDSYRALLALAYRQKGMMTLFISPAHARRWEVMAASGLWDTFEQWKAMLVSINEDEARKAGRPAFALWDFSGYNRITTETLPPLGDSTTPMKWYWDSSHYKKETGDLMLDRMFGTRGAGEAVPGGFGVRLSRASLPQVQQQIRAERERYVHTHPEDIAELRAMQAEVDKVKRCQPGEKQ